MTVFPWGVLNMETTHQVAKNRLFRQLELVFPEGNGTDLASTLGAECNHSWNIRDGGKVFCDTCGLQGAVCQGPAVVGSTVDFDIQQKRRASDRSVSGELLKMNFPRQVCETACQTFQRVSNGKNFRCKSRQALLCVCIFAAQRTYGMSDDYRRLQSLFGVSNRRMLQGLKRICFYQQSEPIKASPTNASPTNASPTPAASSGDTCATSNVPAAEPHSEMPTSFSVSVEEMVHVMMATFDSSRENTSAVIRILRMVIGKSDMISRSRPQSLAASVVFFWSNTTGRPVDMEEFSIMMGLSVATILWLHGEISRLVRLAGLNE